MLRQASDTGALYGSVSSRDLVTLFEADGIKVTRVQIMLDAPLKTIGLHKVVIAVHPEVEATVTVTVARNADEAERINRGEDVTVRREEQDEAAEALAAAEEFFEPEALKGEDGEATEAAEDKSAKRQSCGSTNQKALVFQRLFLRPRLYFACALLLGARFFCWPDRTGRGAWTSSCMMSGSAEVVSVTVERSGSAFGASVTATAGTTGVTAGAAGVTGAGATEAADAGCSFSFSCSFGAASGRAQRRRCRGIGLRFASRGRRRSSSPGSGSGSGGAGKPGSVSSDVGWRGGVSCEASAGFCASSTLQSTAAASAFGGSVVGTSGFTGSTLSGSRADGASWRQALTDLSWRPFAWRTSTVPWAQAYAPQPPARQTSPSVLVRALAPAAARRPAACRHCRARSSPSRRPYRCRWCSAGAGNPAANRARRCAPIRAASDGRPSKSPRKSAPAACPRRAPAQQPASRRRRSSRTGRREAPRLPDSSARLFIPTSGTCGKPPPKSSSSSNRLRREWKGAKRTINRP